MYISGSFCIFLNHNYYVTIRNDSVLFNLFHKEQHDSFRVTVADRGFSHIRLKFHTQIIGFSFMFQYLLDSVLHKMVSGRENSMSSNDTHRFPEIIRATWAHVEVKLHLEPPRSQGKELNRRQVGLLGTTSDSFTLWRKHQVSDHSIQPGLSSLSSRPRFLGQQGRFRPQGLCSSSPPSLLRKGPECVGSPSMLPPPAVCWEDQSAFPQFLHFHSNSLSYFSPKVQSPSIHHRTGFQGV